MRGSMDNGGNGRRPSIRPVSREVPKRRGSSLRECRCFDEVERRVRMGWTSAAVAKMIQIEYKELTDLSQRYVAKMVDEFRKTIPPAELVLSTSNPMVARNAQKKLATGLNELEELEKLYEIQKKRVAIDFENEQKINKLFPTTGREIFFAMKLLKQSADLKMDLGILKRQLGEVSVTAQAAGAVAGRYGDEVGQTLTDPDSRRRVLGMVETLRQLAAKADVDALDVVRGAARGQEVIDVEPVESEPKSVDSAEE